MSVEQFRKECDERIVNEHFMYDESQTFGYLYLQSELYAIKLKDVIVLVKARSPRESIEKVKASM